MISNPKLKRLVSRAYKNGHGELHLKSTDEVRKHLESLKPPGVVDCEHEDYNPEPLINFRLYRSHEAKFNIVFVRASAYTGGGTLDDTNGICDTIRQLFQANVISLNFRSPPEYKFPIYFDDVCRTTLWLKHNASLLNLTQPFVSWGESSGGALVASLNQYLCKQNLNFFKGQILIYPMLDLVTHTQSRREFSHGYMLDVAMINWLEQRVLNDSSERHDYRASPGLHTAKNLPPLILLTCACDPLRDEGTHYANQLQRNGVNVKQHCVPNMIHGFLRYYHKIEEAKDALAWIKQQTDQLLQK